MKKIKSLIDLQHVNKSINIFNDKMLEQVKKSG